MGAVAVLDLGSNTVKITVAELSSDGIEILDERVRATRIVEGRKGPRLARESVERTLSELEALSEGLPTHRLGVATASLRGAEGQEAIRAELRCRTGFELEVISGIREAELAFLGPQTLYGRDLAVSFDVGGHSSEVSGLRRGVWKGDSFPVGALSVAANLIDPPDARAQQEMRRRSREALTAFEPDFDPGRVVGVSGTALAILGISRDTFDMKALLKAHDGGVVTAEALEEMIGLWAAKPSVNRIRGDVIPAMRADALIGGLVLVSEILARLKAPSFHITPRGVRHGLLVELQRRNTGTQ
ncbi:MAG: hypothetical protein AAGD10_07215 [Myxococcota bacterium]